MKTKPRSRKRTPFTDWLDGELAMRGWKDHQLAINAGVSHSVISKARTGITPKWEACTAIAAALGVSKEFAFRKAGLLDPEADEQADLEEWKAILNQLTEQERYELLRIARLKLELQERNAGRADNHPGARKETIAS